MSDNELIAEFMGAKNVSKTKGVLYSFIDNIDFCEAIAVQTKDGEYLFYLKDLIFDKSWDWLMPVVISIEELEEPHPSNNPEKGTVWPYQIEILSRNVVQIIDNRTDDAIVSVNKDGLTKIQSVYKAVVEFIKWYNQQTK